MVKHVFILIISSLTTAISFATVAHAQKEIGSAKILAICEEGAKTFLKNKTEAIYAKVTDDILKANKLAIIAAYETQINIVNNNLVKLIREKKLSKTDDIINLAFSEYKKSIPDLPQEYYDKTLADIKEERSR